VLDYLNKQHPNIRFTIEHEQNNSLPFLDTEVIRRVNKYSTTIYRKKTFTGVYLNWTSMTARRYKIGLIKCLAERIWRICSDQERRLAELEKLKTILRKNNYPEEVVELSIAKFLESKATPQPPTVTQDEKVTRFLKLPYVSRKCEDYAFRLKQLVSKNFQQVEFNVAFQIPLTIGNMFPFKDNIKLAHERSLVVYRLSCSTCKADYIGKTERILCHRLKEHASKASSACYLHTQEYPGHSIDYNRVEILDTASSDRKLRIKENMHILDKEPVLNKQLNSQYELKTLLINSAYPHLFGQKQ
jgi:hypothetical protein